ncbi:MAG TPA: isoprenylcysteine carboxylmethyltransferase family protein [Bacillota bacterium]|nr:MAG: Isoprenylcysteine carboxyl methyltransferase (ICMT) family protein [Firmicutes bacterium ADurb.Bin153]HNV35198.1 isoprenylcysteine carboxylmethyltransferase family protein [Bacillota bacterium]
MARISEIFGGPPGLRWNVGRRVLQVASAYVLIALLLFIPAGSARWPAAWVYMVLYLAVIAAGAFMLPVDVISERGSVKENVEKWDRLITGLLFVSSLGVFPVAGFDRRFSWTKGLGPWLTACSCVIFLLGCALDLWAMYANRYFSTSVRIQSERGHTVCEAGPYRIVRHPGYLGMILYNAAGPTLLGSLWALVPAAMTAVLFVLRASLEDKTLRRKLAGYEEYANRVRWRLIPRIW